MWEPKDTIQDSSHIIHIHSIHISTSHWVNLILTLVLQPCEIVIGNSTAVFIDLLANFSLTNSCGNVAACFLVIRTYKWRRCIEWAVLKRDFWTGWYKPITAKGQLGHTPDLTSGIVTLTLSCSLSESNTFIGRILETNLFVFQDNTVGTRIHTTAVRSVNRALSLKATQWWRLRHVSRSDFRTIGVQCVTY